MKNGGWIVTDIPFEVSIVVSSSDARFIGVVSSKDGGGADSAHIEMVEWDDTFGSGAGEMGRGTFMVTMVQ